MTRKMYLHLATETKQYYPFTKSPPTLWTNQKPKLWIMNLWLNRVRHTLFTLSRFPSSTSTYIYWHPCVKSVRKPFLILSMSFTLHRPASDCSIFLQGKNRNNRWFVPSIIKGCCRHVAQIGTVWIRPYLFHENIPHAYVTFQFHCQVVMRHWEIFLLWLWWWESWVCVRTRLDDENSVQPFVLFHFDEATLLEVNKEECCTFIVIISRIPRN